MSRYTKIRQEFFDERVDALRLNKWQIPMKSDPKIKGLTLMYFYPEEVVEELIMRLRLAAGLNQMLDEYPTAPPKPEPLKGEAK